MTIQKCISKSTSQQSE